MTDKPAPENKKPKKKTVFKYVEVASEDSFPCSDPPAWTKVAVSKLCDSED